MRDNCIAGNDMYMSCYVYAYLENGDAEVGVPAVGFLFGASLPICQLFDFTYAFSRESRSGVVCINQYLRAPTHYRV